MDVRPHADLPVDLIAGQAATPFRVTPGSTAIITHYSNQRDRIVKFLLIAGFPDSLLQFRGSLIEALQAENLEVHVAAPDLPAGNAMRRRLEAKGLVIHDIPLRRTGMNATSNRR